MLHRENNFELLIFLAQAIADKLIRTLPRSSNVKIIIVARDSNNGRLPFNTASLEFNEKANSTYFYNRAKSFYRERKRIN